MGVAEYDQASPGQYVVLKLETGGDEDYYLGFNRATGPNAENDEADDEVTVVTTGNNGLSYGLSSLKATLKENETHKVTQWPGGKDLTIQVLEINLEAKPSYAEVIVCYDKCPSLETSDPTSRVSDKDFHDNICFMFDVIVKWLTHFLFVVSITAVFTPNFSADFDSDSCGEFLSVCNL